MATDAADAAGKSEFPSDQGALKVGGRSFCFVFNLCLLL